jgi:O-antigen/teichoic acid export membrane protein
LRRKSVVSSIISTLTRDSLANLGQIILMPLFLINFGPSGYSTWLTILSVTTFIVLADFGLSNVIIGRLMRIYEKHRIFDASLWFWFKRKTFYLALVLTTATGALFYAKYSSDDYEITLVSTNSQVFASLTLASFVTIAQHFWLYKMQIIGCNTRAQSTLTISRLCEVFLFATLLQFNLTLSFFSWLFLLSKLTLLVGLYFSFRKALPIKLSVDSQPETSGMLAPAISNALITSANVLTIHGSFIIASFWLSPAELISLAIARTLSSPIRILGTAVTTGSLPYFIRMFNSGAQKDEDVSMLNTVIRKSIFLVSAIALIIFLFSEVAWDFLGNQMIQFNQGLVLFFCISTLSDSIVNLKLQRYLASNTALIPGAVYFCMTIVFISSQTIIGELFGVVAVPICILVADWITIGFQTFSRRRNAS